jgi:hypothetical protein
MSCRSRYSCRPSFWGCSVVDERWIGQLLLLLPLPKLIIITDSSERLLDILTGYGVRPRIRGLLRFYWDHQQSVAWQADYHGEAFQPSRGVTQGGIISPTLFNILVDAVVRKWLADILEDLEVAISGLQDAVEGKIALFCADDGMVGSDDPEWLRGAYRIDQNIKEMKHKQKKNRSRFVWENNAPTCSFGAIISRSRVFLFIIHDLTRFDKKILAVEKGGMANAPN